MYIEKSIPNPHLPIRQDWLNLRTEEAIDPSLPIIDPHHHLWNQNGKPYMLPELLGDINSGHNVIATVAVECRSMYRKGGDPEMAALGEVEFINGIAAMSASGDFGKCLVASGIVGHANLLLGSEVAGVLDAQMQAASSRYRGLRMSSIWHPDPSASATITKPPKGLLLDRAFREGFKQLASRGLSFDAWLYHTQIEELIDLANTYSETQIILNHTGGPNGIGPFAGKRQEVFEDWSVGMKKLSNCPNVVVKIGGLGMKVFGFDFTEKALPPNSDDLLMAWKPYAYKCIELFGTNRCMFESNFPVDKGAASYVVVWNAFKKICQNFTENEKSDLFFNTANRVYKLNATA